MNAKPTLDRAITLAAAVAAPVLALLIHHHVITAQDGVDLGAIEAAAIGSYHGGAYVQRRHSDQAQPGGAA